MRHGEIGLRTTFALGVALFAATVAVPMAVAAPDAPAGPPQLCTTEEEEDVDANGVRCDIARAKSAVYRAVEAAEYAIAQKDNWANQISEDNLESLLERTRSRADELAQQTSPESTMHLLPDVEWGSAAVARQTAVALGGFDQKTYFSFGPHGEAYAAAQAVESAARLHTNDPLYRNNGGPRSAPARLEVLRAETAAIEKYKAAGWILDTGGSSQ
ncbi:hypothetical protein [Nocardia brasiliensis]|uniref:hypothetical protein n=1 Tax=Nocardia brasiliensis TaxID=37326 RepID=UPI0024559517|nr:hypothetical protein [Nocardia brasiliensis]